MSFSSFFRTLAVLSLIYFSFLFNTGIAQDTLKIMSYNLLNYSGGDAKDQNFRKTVKYSDPDILAVCEIISQSAVNNMLSNVMNYYQSGLYSAGTFLDGEDTDNAIFYKTSEFNFLGNTPIHTSLRDINLFTLVHIATRDTIRIFEVHLKASEGSSNEQQRLSEVNILRTVTNAYANGTEFLVMGDFNIYTANEPAYVRLLQVEQTNEGHFIDPDNLPGTWNQSSYSIYHSQSTRTRSIGDGGATGGMDDRFDFILNSKGLTEEGRIKFIPGTLKPFGNDGNHYNDSINQRPNTSVPDSIADALYYGSDHLPVYALYKFDQHPISVNNISQLIPDNFKLYQNYPNPFNPVTKIRFDVPANLRGERSNVKLIVYNSIGKEVGRLVDEALQAGSYEADFNASGLSSGAYFYRLEISGTRSYVQTRSMTLVK